MKSLEEIGREERSRWGVSEEADAEFNKLSVEEKSKAVAAELKRLSDAFQEQEAEALAKVQEFWSGVLSQMMHALRSVGGAK